MSFLEYLMRDDLYVFSRVMIIPLFLFNSFHILRASFVSVTFDRIRLHAGSWLRNRVNVMSCVLPQHVHARPRHNGYPVTSYFRTHSVANTVIVHSSKPERSFHFAFAHFVSAAGCEEVHLIRCFSSDKCGVVAEGDARR